MKRGLSKRRFDEIYREGKRVSGAVLRLLADRGEGRVGIATARAIGAKPHRNRQRRRVAEIMRAADDLRVDLDYVVVVGRDSVETPFDELRRELMNLVTEMNRRWAAESESP